MSVVHNKIIAKLQALDAYLGYLKDLQKANKKIFTGLIVIVILLVGFVFGFFLHSALQDSIPVPSVLPKITNSEATKDVKDSVRNIYVAKYKNSDKYDVFIDGDDRFFGNRRILESYPNNPPEIDMSTRKDIIETTAAAKFVDTLLAPDQSYIIFSLSIEVPETIVASTPKEHGPYVRAYMTSVFTYTFSDNTVRELFKGSSMAEIYQLCPKEFSPDEKAVLFSCDEGGYLPEGTLTGMVYSFITEKIYHIESVLPFEWSIDNQFRYKELKEIECDPPRRIIENSEGSLCFEDSAKMSWKYQSYR